VAPSVTSRTWHLKHEITLTIHYGRPAPPIASIEGFLGNVMVYFKKRRDELHEEIYADGPPPVGSAISGRKFYGNCHLAHMGDEVGNYLPTDHWVQAIIAAYSISTTLIDIQNEIHAYEAQANGWLKDVVQLLKKRGGELDAFEYMLNRQA
jgi:hypothetical protein